MGETRRRLLMTGAALGVTGAALAGCDSGTTPVDNATANSTTGAPPAGGDTGSSGGGTAGAAGGSGVAPTPGTRIRYDVASPQGQAMLAIYARAVGLMMAAPEGDPRSWTFQWYAHWVKGAQDASGKSAELARIYGGAASPQQALAQRMWDGCQAHGANEDESFFLPWHRMYVMAFETIVRAVAEAPEFTLPYWNYLDPGQRAIPSEFRRPGDPTWGALYRSARNPPVNAGSPIASAADLSPEVLSEASYSALGADQGFCSNLDLGLHGAVHVGVGNATTGMGVVPWAAGDPIFWLHHCNIDRMWASWNAAGNANPADADFTAKPFVFAGADGAQITYTVGQVLSLGQAGYGYDALIGVDGQPEAVQQAARLEAPGQRAAEVQPLHLPFIDAAQAQPLQPPRDAALGREPERVRAAPVLRTLPSITHVAEGVQLGAGTIRVRLTSTQATPQLAARTLAPLIAPPLRMQRRMTAAPAPRSAAGRLMALLQPRQAAKPPPVMAMAPAPAPPPPSIPAPKPGQKVFLVLSNLTTDVQPGVLYQIYLEAPGGRGGAAQPFAIGSLNFFSAMGGMGGMSMSNKSRSYDITDLADQLASQGRLEANPAVSFVPVGKPASQAQPLIDSVSLAIQ